MFTGNAILAHPVVTSGATSVNVYLPGGPTQFWYDIEDFKQYQGIGGVNIPVTLDKVIKSNFILTCNCLNTFLTTKRGVYFENLAKITHTLQFFNFI